MSSDNIQIEMLPNASKTAALALKQKHPGGARPKKGEELPHATMIRLPVGLRNHLVKCADAQFRSLTGEICARLYESIEGESFDEHGVIVRAPHRSAK